MTGLPSPICARGRGRSSPICPESGTLPRPRPRFAEIGDHAVVLEYPKGVLAEGFAQVWSHNSQITRRTGQLCPDTPTFPIWLAIAPSTRRRQGMMLSARAVRTSLGALAQARSTFRRLPAEQTTRIDWRKADGTKDHPAWASVPIETEPSKYDLVVLLALKPMSQGREHHPIRHCGGTEYGRLPWLALRLPVLGGHTSNAALGGLPFDCAAYKSCRTCRLPWVTTSSR